MGHYLEFNARTQPKGGFPCLLSRGTEGKEQSHIYRLWWCSYKWPPPPPHPPRGFPPLLFIPASSWEDMFPHCDQNESGFFLSWLCPLSPQRYPAALWLCRGKVGRVRGLPSRGTSTPSAPPTLSQFSTGIHITDKHWQMGSGKWFFTHSRDISN